MKKFIPLSLSLTILAGSLSAIADEAADTKSKELTLEEIVVTAQRREQGIREVPISISALSGEDLNKRGLDNLRDYSNFVPGMVFSGTAFVGERSGPDITIRGVANSRLFDFETSIATATTGFVYGQMPAYAFDPRLMDINRIEVLKGPQGTLYGAASMGGTVKVVPNAPDAAGFSAKFSGGLGYTADGGRNYEFSAMANIPIIEDVLAVRMSAFNFLDSGYIDARLVTGNPNEQRGGNTDLVGIDANDFNIFNIDESARNVIENINEIETTGGQVAAKYTPDEKFDATLSIFFQSKDEKSLPNFEPSLSSKQNKRTTELFILQPSSTDYTLAQLEMRYDLGFANIYSVSGFLNRKFTNATDFSAITFGALGGVGAVPGTAPVNFIADVNVYSQELRLQGDTDVGFGTGLRWTIGYFYQKEDRDSTGSVTVSPAWMVNGAAVGALPPSGTNLVWGGEFKSVYKNNSAFIDLTLGLTENIEVSAGARRSHQTLNSRRVDFGNVFAGASTPTGTTLDVRRITENQTTPRFAITFAASENINLYASASKGFRIGGANPAANLSTPGCQNALSILGITEAGAFQSDSVWNYEVGAKSSLADGRVELNISGFHIKWKDLQVSTSLSAVDGTCGASVVANVGAAEINGAEVEFKALVTENIELGVVAEYNDAKLTEGSAGVPGATVGDPLKNIPDFTVALGVQYNFAPTNGIDTYVRVDYVYTDERSFSDVAAGPSAAFNLPAYDLLNLRIGAVYDDWEFIAYVDNVLDEVPQLGVTNLPGGPGDYVSGSSTQRFVSTSRPRTAGVRISKKY